MELLQARRRQGAPPNPMPRHPPRRQFPMDLSVKLVKITGGHFSRAPERRACPAAGAGRCQSRSPRFRRGQRLPVHLRDQSRGRRHDQAGWQGRADRRRGCGGKPRSAPTSTSTSSISPAPGITQSAPAIAGLIGFQSTLESDGKVAQVKGKLKAENLKLAKDGKPAKRPVEFDFAVDHNLRKRSGQLHQGADQDRQRAGQPHRHVRATAANPPYPDESGRSENACHGTRRHAARDGDRAAQRIVAGGRHGQREARHARRVGDAW